MKQEQIRVKICGLTQPEEIAFVNEAQPDFAGFVIGVPKSRRSLTPEQARSLRAQLAPGITAVGVFVNAPPDAAAGLVLDHTIDAVQLHGDEDEAYIRKLRGFGSFPIIRAFNEKSIGEAGTCSADLILLDHASGGTGEPFDWELAKKLQRPFLLAGGIGPENLADAIAALHPWGVDMSSRLETNGRKDREKIRAAVRIAREGQEECSGRRKRPVGGRGIAEGGTV